MASPTSVELLGLEVGVEIVGAGPTVNGSIGEEENAGGSPTELSETRTQ